MSETGSPIHKDDEGRDENQFVFNGHDQQPNISAPIPAPKIPHELLLLFP